MISNYNPCYDFISTIITHSTFLTQMNQHIDCDTIMSFYQNLYKRKDQLKIINITREEKCWILDLVAKNQDFGCCFPLAYNICG